MKHQILAPSKGDAERLVRRLDTDGHHARVASYGGFHVVLALAPLASVNKACRAVSFEAGRPAKALR